MKKSLFLLTSICFILACATSCKKDNQHFGNQKAVTDFGHGVLGYITPVNPNMVEIELKADNSVFLKGISEMVDGKLLIRYLSTDNELYCSFKVDADGNLSDYVFNKRIPLRNLFNTQHRDADIILPPADDPILKCMGTNSSICATTPSWSGAACKGLISTFSMGTTIGWIVRCTFGW